MFNRNAGARRWMLMGSAALLALLASTPTAAATAAATDTAAPAEVGELVVTGSRIPRLNLESATPTVAVTATKIEASSSSEVGALLRDLPASGAAFASPQSTGSLVSNNFGTSTFNLRNLSENRTLVLVDSRRFVSGSASGNFVDFNAIPLEMIERIDVVTGGASAIYGSDALAGVVNIITRKDFRGLVISGQGGKGIYGDAQNYRLSATGGAPFADGAGQAVVSLNWSRDDGAYARNRPWEAVDSIAASALGAVDSSDITTIVSPFFSSYSEKGRVNLTNGSRFVVDDDGVVKPFSTARDGFNRQAFRGIAAPVQRIGASANLDYKVSDAVKWFAQLTYNSTRAQVAAEPFPLDSYNIYGANVSGNQPQCPVTAGVAHCVYGIPLTSALVPEAIRVVERAAQPGVPDSDLVVGFSRRMSDIATRDGYAQRQTYRVVTGFTGDLPFGFTYDTSLDFGRTTSDQHSTGQVNVINMRFALDAEVGPGGVLRCRDATARLEGCVPINIFGRGKVSAAAANYVAADNGRESLNEELVANGFVQGPVFTLPAGQARLVLGAEYRREKLEDVPDSLTQSGLNANNITPPTFGSFHVGEAFAELRVPLFKDMAYAKEMNLDFSARLSNYSTVGHTSAYAVNADWKPLDELRLRAQYARAVRAPNLFELFSPGSQTFPSITDPCQGVTKTAGGVAAFLRNPSDGASGIDTATIGNAEAGRCLADPNIAQRVNDRGSLVLSQPEVQSVSGFISGNPALKPETSSSYSIGFVLRPAWMEWMRPASLSVDWYRIDVDKGIGIFGQQTTADQCYQTGSPVYCSQITRNGPGAFQGSLGLINQTTLNLSTITSEGLDVQFNYDLSLERLSPNAGGLTFDVLYTHLFEFSNVPFPGAAKVDSTGVLGAPANRATVDLTYHNGPVRLFWDVNIVGGVDVDNYPGAHVAPQAFHNFQAKLDVNRNLTLIAGVDNVFNHFVLLGGTGGEISSTVVSTTVGQRTEPTSYDGLGRRWYAAFRLKF